MFLGYYKSCMSFQSSLNFPSKTMWIYQQVILCTLWKDWQRYHVCFIPHRRDTLQVQLILNSHYSIHWRKSLILLAGSWTSEPSPSPQPEQAALARACNTEGRHASCTGSSCCRCCSSDPWKKLVLLSCGTSSLSFPHLQQVERLVRQEKLQQTRRHLLRWSQSSSL